MRKLFLLLSVLLLGLSWAVAQESSTSPSQSSSSRTSAGQMTVEGCLSGSSGNFTLTDKNGTSYQLTGDTAKLSEHVGHEVKVTGTSSAEGATSSTGAPAAGSAGAGQTLQVSSVKHVSKTCKSGNSGMSH